ncbi:MAG TPA: nuclear transport factor 2 family protein [Solirubrobacteraceae bacterium]|nr:nuclear transport factor 2 family protein [Solirubrobacteraceae bacterium]
MSRENLEIYKRSLAAINAREFPDELAEELLAVGFHAENASTAVTDKAYFGREGVREWIRDMFEGLNDDAQLEIEEVLVESDDFVLAQLRIVGHGARSGAPVTLRWVDVTWFEDRKMTRGVGYLRRSEAFKAVGLAE